MALIQIFNCPFCSKTFKNERGISVHVGKMHKDQLPLPVTLPIKCIHCGNEIIKRGTQWNSLLMGIVNGIKNPFHRRCYLTLYHPMKNPINRNKLRGRPHPWMMGDKNVMHRPEVKAKFTGDSSPMRRPEVAAKCQATRRKNRGGAYYTPEELVKMSERISGDNNPAKKLGVGLKISTALRRLGDNHPSKRPEYKSYMSKINMGDNNPMRNHKNFANWRKTMSKRPNKPETRLIPILKEFGFVSHKGIEIYRDPDFVHEYEKRIIEYDGFAGHNPAHPWTPVTWEDCLAKDDKRDQAYRDVGYKVLRIFPEDLSEGDDFVRTKVAEWMLQ